MSGILFLLLLGYWPLPANYGITGTFMEYRNQHLHAGFDLSTDGKVGFPVHCFDDGKIVLIKVQKRGYGRVLYIRHPKRKLVSVYGHLNRFSPGVEKLVSRYQIIRNTRYPGTIIPNRPIPVRKGQVIAWTGESGVGWPHLHFELRNLNNEPVNPVNYGFSVATDQSPPIFQSLNLYPETPSDTINGRCRPLRLPIRKLKSGDFTTFPFRISGSVLMSITILDTDGRKGPLAVHEIQASLNRKSFYRYHANIFSYDRFNRASSVYDLSRTRLSPATYSYNLFRIEGSGLLSQEISPMTFKTGKNLLTITTEDFAGHKILLHSTFHWQKQTKAGVLPETFTTVAVLLKGEIVPASEIHDPVSTQLKGENWLVVPYGETAGNVKLGEISLLAEGYNTHPRLLFVRKKKNLPKEKGLTRIPGTGIEIEPGQLFLSRLTLSYRWQKENPAMGWFRYDEIRKKWKYRNSVFSGKNRRISASDFRNGIYALFLDTVAPVIHGNPYLFRNRTAWRVTDLGKGVDDTSIEIMGKGKKLKMEYDPDRKIAWVDGHLPKGNYKIIVKDLAGNTSSAKGRLH